MIQVAPLSSTSGTRDEPNLEIGDPTILEKREHQTSFGEKWSPDLSGRLFGEQAGSLDPGIAKFVYQLIKYRTAIGQLPNAEYGNCLFRKAPPNQIFAPARLQWRVPEQCFIYFMVRWEFGYFLPEEVMTVQLQVKLVRRDAESLSSHGPFRPALPTTASPLENLCRERTLQDQLRYPYGCIRSTPSDCPMPSLRMKVCCLRDLGKDSAPSRNAEAVALANRLRPELSYDLEHLSLP